MKKIIALFAATTMMVSGVAAETKVPVTKEEAVTRMTVGILTKAIVATPEISACNPDADKLVLTLYPYAKDVGREYEGKYSMPPLDGFSQDSAYIVMGFGLLAFSLHHYVQQTGDCSSLNDPVRTARQNMNTPAFHAYLKAL